MPSLNDGSSSSQYLPRDISDLSCALETCEDPTFHGLEKDYEAGYRVHGLCPTKCVAFEGTNTRRKFYLCSVPNQVENCGFVRWLDEEWPETLKNALSWLWEMYHTSESAIIKDRIQHVKFVNNVRVIEKNFKKEVQVLKTELAVLKRHKSTVKIDTALLEVIAENIALTAQVKCSYNGCGSIVSYGALLEHEHKHSLDEVQVVKKEVGVLKRKVSLMKKKVSVLKHTQKIVHDEWIDESEKVKNIKAICDE